MAITVHSLQEEDILRWNEFVDRSPDATFFHLAEWKSVIECAFGHETHFLYAERNGRIEGILPLAQVKSRLFGHSLVSTPFCVYGGPVAQNQDALDELRQAACSLAQKLQVDTLELRNTRPANSDWPTKDLYVTFRKQIDSDNDLNMKAIPRKQRAMVRKGIAAGMVSEADSCWRRLYKVYAESLRNLGTPVFSARYFEILQQAFDDRCRIMMVTFEGLDVAGVMSFYFRDQVLPYYGGSTSNSRNIQGVNDFMYWELMRRSAEDGCRLFDFGRSKKGTGSFNFKKNWGFTPEPLYYEYYLVKSDVIPEVNPMNPRYRFLINSWKKLPVPVTNTLGPFLARNLG